MPHQPTHFHDGEPIPDGYMDTLSHLINEAVVLEEKYGSEEERIAHPEDWPLDSQTQEE